MYPVFFHYLIQNSTGVHLWPIELIEHSLERHRLVQHLKQDKYQDIKDLSADLHNKILWLRLGQRLALSVHRSTVIMKWKKSGRTFVTLTVPPSPLQKWENLEEGRTSYQHSINQTFTIRWLVGSHNPFEVYETKGSWEHEDKIFCGLVTQN